MVNLRHVLDGERYLVYAAAAAMPFLLVRIAYSIANAFANNGTFNIFNPEVYVRAFMQVFMEFIIAGIVIVAGFVTQRPPRTAAKGGDVKEGPDTRELQGGKDDRMDVEAYR